MQLNSAPPANVVYAGSYFGSEAVPGVDVLGVHHPAGDLQKMSIGSIRGYTNCSFGSNGSAQCLEAGVSDGAMFRVSWRQGTTEGGSSGSAIFVQANNDVRYVVGALSSGSASCQNPSGTDAYGRFELSFADGIRNWLTR